MKALLVRFDLPSQREAQLEETANQRRRQLAARLSKPERKMLLRLTDLEDALRDEAKLDSFISGFKLAQGIQQELNPPYSFEDEDEENACKQAKQEVNASWRRNEPTARAVSANGKTAAGKGGTRRGMTPTPAKRFTKMCWAKPRRRSRKS